MQEYIEIRGARENNLKDVTLKIPKPDTPRHEWTEVLPSSSQLARTRLPRTSRGCLSRSVAYSLGSTRFRMPCGTVSCLLQDVESSIVISIKH